MEGQVAGLTIKQTSGAPGGGSVMRIRGVSSIGGSNSPLFVVDGVPMHETYGKDQSPLSIIDQADIESIDILKDVSATAIYGSRGSNGVVIITTRSGMQGKTEVRFSANTGLEKMHSSAKMPVMNAEEFARWRKEDAYEYANYYGEEISIDDIPVEYQDPEYWIGKGTDWQDVMTRVSPHHSYNLNITHGTEDFTGYFSIGYTHNDRCV